MDINYATNIALVDKETSTVSNVIWGLIYQMDEFNTEKYLAVQIDDLAVQIGDTYDGTDFYHEGEKVLSRYEQINATMTDMESALNILGVSE